MAEETETDPGKASLKQLIDLLVADQAVLQAGFLQDDALAAAEHIHAACAMLQVMAKSLEEACQLLEGWGRWKCPPKERAAHLATIDRFRSLIA